MTTRRRFLQMLAAVPVAAKIADSVPVPDEIVERAVAVLPPVEEGDLVEIVSEARLAPMPGITFRYDGGEAIIAPEVVRHFGADHRLEMLRVPTWDRPGATMPGVSSWDVVIDGFGVAPAVPLGPLTEMEVSLQHVAGCELVAPDCYLLSREVADGLGQIPMWHLVLQVPRLEWSAGG